MKLFVDDFRECPEGWTPARTVTEAIRLLDTHFSEITVVSLDHDIRQCSGSRCHNRDETFEPVARHISAKMYLAGDQGLVPHIRIHTGNMQAGARMAEIMRMPYIPYIYDPDDYKSTDTAGEGK